MRQNIKNSILLLTTLVISATSCTTNLPSNSPEAIALGDVINNTFVLPKVNKGGISGYIIDQTVTTTAKANETTETVVKIIRNEDIFDKDDKGNIKKDSKTGKEIKLEEKGKIIQTIKLKDKTNFYVNDLLPGAVAILVTKRQETVQIESTVELGKVNELRPIILGALSSGGSAPNPRIIPVNIAGKIVKADGTPISGAKVNDVTGGFVSVSATTDGDGKFKLTEQPFTTPRSLEVNLGEPDQPGTLSTSYSVTPDQTEDLTIPLVPNSRAISGRLLDSVLKTTPISNLTVKIEGTNISTSTDDNGNFKLKGVPLTQVNLSVGGLKSYVPKNFVINASQVSDELKLGDNFIKPLGSAIVNIIAESTPIINQTENGNIYTSRTTGTLSVSAVAGPVVGGIATGVCEINAQNDPLSAYPLLLNSNTGRLILPAQYVLLATGGLGSCEYVNNLTYKQPLQGLIQFEGTDLKYPFTYPLTPTRDVTIFSGIQKQTLAVDAPNAKVSVPINDIPGGEYTISISLEHHRIQKGVKLVIPSNDITSTELIEMFLAKPVTGVGDIAGNIVVKDRNGAVQSIPSGISLVAINTDKKTEEALTESRIASIFSDTTGTVVLSQATVGSDGSYILKNVPSGTAIIIAAAIGSDGKVDPSLLPATYVLVNVVSGRITKATDLVMIKR